MSNAKFILYSIVGAVFISLFLISCTTKPTFSYPTTADFCANQTNCSSTGSICVKSHSGDYLTYDNLCNACKKEIIIEEFSKGACQKKNETAVSKPKTPEYEGDKDKWQKFLEATYTNVTLIKKTAYENYTDSYDLDYKAYENGQLKRIQLIIRNNSLVKMQFPKVYGQEGDPCGAAYTKCDTGLICYTTGTCLTTAGAAAECAKSGGVWGKWGIYKSEGCNFNAIAKDSGAPCSKKQDCISECVQDEKESSAKCFQYTELTGCHYVLDVYGKRVAKCAE